ncbi:hypothetical protein K431DRAFT_125965 [Polychaeton citri CBS 116435]|uniref:Uncharacterized protein n=1 Tax=Polychaeton citri CBS 116435 TaxID=1314669 RepID=A0A9P4ULP9_9PEZI|nr:hypothetical protein K431DRAFT_125965 [Polychaeton citri CBS 116435]
MQTQASVTGQGSRPELDEVYGTNADDEVGVWEGDVSDERPLKYRASKRLPGVRLQHNEVTLTFSHAQALSRIRGSVSGREGCD